MSHLSLSCVLHSKSYCPNCPYCIPPRPAKWNGEGLPPVGTVCEYQTIGATNDWQEVEILCHFTAQKEVAVFVPVSGYRNVKQAIAECFRPIRTPEQIAAEERELGIVEMCELFMRNKGDVIRVVDCCERLYDAGCRMPGKGAKA